MTRHFCDECHTETTRTNRVSVTLRGASNVMGLMPLIQTELCPACWHALVAFVQPKFPLEQEEQEQ